MINYLSEKMLIREQAQFLKTSRIQKRTMEHNNNMQRLVRPILADNNSLPF